MSKTQTKFDARFAVGEVIRHLAGLHRGKEKLLERYSHLFAGKVVLDYGCGTGFSTQFYARTAKQVCAYDTNAYALALAQEMHAASNITYYSTLPNLTFDVIVCNDSLEFNPDWRALLSELRTKAPRIIITAPSFQSKRKLFSSLFVPKTPPILSKLESGTNYKSLYQRDFDIPAYCTDHQISFECTPFALDGGLNKNHRLYVL